MTHKRRDAAIFVAGIASWETLGHWFIGLWARDLLPMNVLGFEFTAQMNTIAMVAWPAVFAGMAYIAWFRRPRATAASQNGQAPQAGTHATHP
jgi:hypothetical protein